ncbi:unnamed protein product [Meganyctiphanes norvegica]|uniref:Uncharacterized protein n=1 Tax=Meganyctiphanes norvegica TaxID=48144 RepID=A0AAV2QI11_MEGNR
MLAPCFFILICSCLTSAAPGVKDQGLNMYIDMVLANVQIIMMESGFDPATLPNITVHFGKNDSGVAGLEDGWMNGISNLYRSADMDFLNEDGILSGMKGGIGLGALEGHYDCIAHALFGERLLADVLISNSGGEIEFAAKLNHQTCHFEIDKFNLKHIGKFHVDIHGLGILNWIAEIVASSTIAVVKPFVVGIIEVSVKSIMNQVFGLIELGPLGPVFGCEVQPTTTNYLNVPRKF